ncbi:hypothetical protein DUI87_06186 [Hirundo rustica rustica]|uniref:Uncharacterized protein n=1 Tax=Hirundo rustica rustica TaxID=333673 RepID=A0A3M0KW60_HIRRU|nr:hypothetical protein DUI87_06186 [Hirundo rustica rustica]
MFKAEVPSTHHATNATWSKWIALITQRARIGNPNRPGILEIITNWPEGENFGLMDEEEQEQVTRAEEAPPYNQLPAEETRYALFTDGSCRVVGMNRKWKAAVWSPTRQVAQATEGEGGSSQLAELKAVQLALDIAEREKWPKLYLYTDSWMVANALWGWLEKWKKANWQRRGKPIWAADEWKDIATRVEKLPVKVRHVDAHVPKSRANEEHQNNEQVDQAAKIEVSKIDLDWQHKGELFLARWAHDASGHQGRDATYKWARDRGVDLTMDSISQVIHDCETCAAIKQAKRVKPLWYGGRWSKYKYGEAWQIDYITLPQTRQGKRYVLTMVEATTGWLETYPVPHATARNTILGLEKQVLWRHGTPERIESDNGTHFKNSLINNWAREHGIEWVYHIPYHAPASGKIERYNGLLKTTLKALGGGSFKNWEQHLAKATWLVNTRGSTNRAGPAQSESLHTVDGEKVPVVHVRAHSANLHSSATMIGQLAAAVCSVYGITYSGYYLTHLARHLSRVFRGDDPESTEATALSALAPSAPGEEAKEEPKEGNYCLIPAGVTAQLEYSKPGSVQHLVEQQDVEHSGDVSAAVTPTSAGAESGAHESLSPSADEPLFLNAAEHMHTEVVKEAVLVAQRPLEEPEEPCKQKQSGDEEMGAKAE